MSGYHSTVTHSLTLGMTSLTRDKAQLLKKFGPSRDISVFETEELGQSFQKTTANPSWSRQKFKSAREFV